MNVTTVNDAQREAICHGDGPMMVLAGPGSGKTFVITHRIQYLIEQGVPPEEILVITFTKAAAFEMQARFQALMGDVYAPVRFGTFHAVYFHILRKELHYDASCILSEKEKAAFLKEILWCHFPEKANLCSPQIILSSIAKVKNEGKEPEGISTPELEPDAFKQLFRLYEDLKKQRRKLDFEDMVLGCRELFHGHLDILQRWREVYRYILIDEFQDINQMQYEVVRLLAAPRNNLFIVGDDDQSIYGFRGSCPEIMLHFPEEFPSCRCVFLNVNYRSSRDVVRTASDFITCNQNRYEKKISSHKPPLTPVRLCCYESKLQQAQGILDEIRRRKESCCFNEMAVLIRTNRGADMLTEILHENKIPFRFREHPVSVFSKSYALDLLSFLRFVFEKPMREDLLRFLNRPVRYLSRELFQERIIDWENILQQNAGNPRRYQSLRLLSSQIRTAQRMDLYAAAQYFLKGMGYESYLRQACRDGRMDRDEVFGDLEIIKKSLGTVKTVEDWMDQIEAYEKALNGQMEETVTDAVNILTMHRSKGLEFTDVYLPDLNEGNMPQGKADSRAEIEEERRVLYVAMTRAKEHLILSYVAGKKENRLLKSRFLKQMKYLEAYDSSSPSSPSSSSSISSSKS